MSEIDRREFLVNAVGAAGAFAALSIVPDVLPAAPRVSGAPLNVGVIGIGRQGRAILGELAKIDAVRVTAICDSDSSRLEAGLRRAAGTEGFDDHRKLLEKNDIAAVVIATPTHQHKQIAIDAVQAGKHVYLEAPIAHTAEDCREIARAARGAKGVFAVGLEGRSNPVYKLARSFFRSDAVRDLISMRAQHHQKSSWRVPVSDPSREKAMNWKLDKEVSIGLAGELGTHQFDVVHWYVGQYPTRVRGSGSIRFHQDGREVADTVACDLAFGEGGGGAHLQYMATLANSFEGRHEVFHGSNASIKLAWSHGWMFKEADAPTQGWEVYANRQQFHNDEGITLIAEATKLASQGKLKEGVGLPHPSLYYALADFVRSITEGAPVVAGAEEGMRATLVGLAAQQAVLTGQTVEITQEMLGAG